MEATPTSMSLYVKAIAVAIIARAAFLFISGMEERSSAAFLSAVPALSVAIFLLVSNRSLLFELIVIGAAGFSSAFVYLQTSRIWWLLQVIICVAAFGAVSFRQYEKSQHEDS